MPAFFEKQQTTQSFIFSSPERVENYKTVIYTSQHTYYWKETKNTAVILAQTKAD